ncbi:arylamine N-acetyltransferase [Dactylosporangium sucinum]|uniref:N-hydroxyarylamine O-acetyltransferase n=1 Tax=Dactylosporangium sucinum TaxID=1424081 RepID=A0A917UA77_9ACTN|nr:arylamine N-acetyltransferase [Dactylosporangium sucinum]GGM72052.1 N-hydroxyarylamine O-acetyltransferase [Dactylosporangium sucinum]
MDDGRIDAYLARIGAERPERADLGALRELQRAHLLAVPFENLSIHLDEPIVLTEEALVAKLVDRRRGGFCYELNGAFAALLGGLGFRVTRHSARVWIGGERFSVPFDHMALLVALDEPYLVDVGFGRFSQQPLRLHARGPQLFADGEYEVVERALPDLDVRGPAGWEYRLDPRPYDLADFTMGAWWHQTSPDSHFTRSLTCSLVTPDGRVTLSGTRLVTTRAGERTEKELTDSQTLQVYRERFGVTLDRLPQVRPR